MKALSIQQPWAWLILSGYKDLENRTWQTKHRGRILIHTGQRVEPNKEDLEYGFFTAMMASGDKEVDIRKRYETEMVTGALVGFASIDECISNSESDWFSGPHAFKLSSPVLWSQGIPYKGRLGLFEVPYEVYGEKR